jgi:hypothetical protein
MTIRRALKAFLLIAVAWAIITAGFGDAHSLTTYSGGTAYWRNDEAYLYLAMGHTGYRVRYIQLPAIWFRQMFNAVPDWDKQQNDSLMVRVTKSSIEKTYLAFGWAHSPNYLTPADNTIYALCGPRVCTWQGDHFQPITRGDNEDISPVVTTDIDEKVVNGWHIKYFGIPRLRPGAVFEIDLSDGSKITVKNESKDLDLPWVKVQLKRPNQNGQTLYDVKASHRFVTSWKYNQVFRGQ